MSTDLERLTEDALRLPLRDRVQLAQRLVSTIDNEVETDTEALWFAEAERRLEELRSGTVQGIDSEDASTFLVNRSSNEGDLPSRSARGR
jgi:putative addiction module component (TIGR02574 family)